MEYRDVYASSNNTATLCYINYKKDMENDGIYLTDMGTIFIGYDINKLLFSGDGNLLIAKTYI